MHREIIVSTDSFRCYRQKRGELLVLSPRALTMIIDRSQNYPCSRLECLKVLRLKPSPSRHEQKAKTARRRYNIFKATRAPSGDMVYERRGAYLPEEIARITEVFVIYLDCDSPLSRACLPRVWNSQQEAMFGWDGKSSNVRGIPKHIPMRSVERR